MKYEIYDFLTKQLGAEETVCEAPHLAGPQMLRITQNFDDMSIWGNSFFTKAREVEEKHAHNFRREAVRISGHFASKCMKPCGTWPEPEFKIDKPGEENPVLEKFRAYMRVEIDDVVAQTHIDPGKACVLELSTR